MNRKYSAVERKERLILSAGVVLVSSLAVAAPMLHVDWLSHLAQMLACMINIRWIWD